MIRVLLVDDEPPARRKLAHLLKGSPDFTVVGEAGSGGEAVDAVTRLRPDLVFLDIQLPDCTGFEVIESLEAAARPQIIFVTAYDDFALKAFEVHALDYLLKPVEPSRFSKTLEVTRRRLEGGDSQRLASRLEELLSTMQAGKNYARRLLIQENGRSLFLDVNRIDWVESARNYACIHASGETHIIRSSLESLAERLDPERFRRISRSAIVNVERIAEVRSWFHGDQKVRLADGTELTWSRRYRAESLEELEKA